MIRDINRSKIVYPAFRKRSRSVSAVASSARNMVADCSTCNRSSASSIFYIPWSNITEATAGAVDVEAMWIPPFGANTTILRLQLLCENAAGNTTVTIRSINEDILATAAVIDISSANTVYEFEFNYSVTDSTPLIIGVDTTVGPQSVRAQLISQETVVS